MKCLKSRQRILTTLEHQEPDRVPFDLGATAVTGIHVMTYLNLLRYWKIEEDQPTIVDQIQQLAGPSESLLQRLCIDTRGVFVRGPQDKIQRRTTNGTKRLVNDFGIELQMSEGSRCYDDVRAPLGGEIDELAINRHRWPDPRDPGLIRGIRQQARDLQDQGYFTVLGSNICGGFFTFGARIRGFSDFFTDLAGYPQRCAWIMDKLIDLKIQFYEALFSETDGEIDAVIEADDLGTQRGLIISRSTYRRHIRPRQKRLFSFIKEHFSGYLIFHSCGSVKELIPDFIEIGVDILNPVQVGATGMDTKKLKREFGQDIVFWGGGIDTQRVLPKGTPDEVEEEVKRRIEDLAPGGGFVFAPVHNIQADVPPANIEAMWLALQQYGKY